ncbi:YceI family protein [Leptospira andrefontaineae]|uniref:YceI family protein n=1 Tax=Leptospira andrefontaineae TaxID=2484976 RepID=A0A4R9H2S0_9LEPT|nr:YceI family protein [Leptospira andrefontaineae]TGK39008.1 YceI family protein [Leptospira andrefontaineae]
MSYLLRFLILFLLSVSSAFSEELKLQEAQVNFIATHPFKTVYGKCSVVTVTPTVLSQAASGLQIPKLVKIEIPISEIKSGDENRDEHIIESLGYPTITNISFSSISIIAKDNEWTITGNLTIKGKTKLVKSVATIQKEGQETILSGKFQVLMSDFDVERPSLLFATAKDEVSIEYKFLLKP